MEGAVFGAVSLCFLRLRSIVMSMSVCLSVREDISGTTRVIFTIFVRVSYVRSSVLLRHVDDRPHRLSTGWGNAREVCIYDCFLRYLTSSSFLLFCVLFHSLAIFYLYECVHVCGFWPPEADKMDTFR